MTKVSIPNKHLEVNMSDYKSVSITKKPTMDYTKYSDNFIFVFNKGMELLMQVKSITAIRVYWIVVNQTRGKQYISHETIAELTGIDKGNIPRAAKELKELGLFLEGRKIKLNPMYVWQGNLVDWQTEVHKLFKEGLVTLPNRFNNFVDN